MLKRMNWTVLFLFLSVASISGGMALKSTFEYSPTFGWFLGFVFIISSSFHATKKLKNTKQ